MRRVIAIAMSLAIFDAAADAPDIHPVVTKFKDTHPFLLQFTDVVAKTANLSLLRDEPIDAGTKEVRAWIGFGVAEPQKMVRIMIDKSGHISGETYLYYHPETQDDRKDSVGVKYYNELHKKCKVLATGLEKEVCVPTNDADTLWGTVYAELIQHHVWTLPDETSLTTPPPAVLDGVAIVIELRDGVQYRAYSYSNPSFNKAPEARDVEAIMKALNKTGDAEIMF